MEMLFSPVQSENASEAIEVTVDGMEMLVRLDDHKKAQ